MTTSHSHKTPLPNAEAPHSERLPRRPLQPHATVLADGRARPTHLQANSDPAGPDRPGQGRHGRDRQGLLQQQGPVGAGDQAGKRP